MSSTPNSNSQTSTTGQQPNAMKPPSAHVHQCRLTTVAGMPLLCSLCPTMVCCFPNKFHCSVYHFCHRESSDASVILPHAPSLLTNITGFCSRRNQLFQVNSSPIFHPHTTGHLLTPRPGPRSCEAEFDGPCH